MADEHELRATSDHTFAIIDRIAQIERDKREVLIGTSEFVELAGEVERLTRLLFRWAGFQRQLAAEASAAAARGEAPNRPIDMIEPRALDRVLALWREEQIRLELAKPGSPEAQAAAEEIERLREEYHGTMEAKLVEDAREEGRFPV